MILWVIFVVVTIACISLARMRIVFTVDPSKLPTVDENTNSNVLMANKYKSSAYLLGWMAVVLLFSGSMITKLAPTLGSVSNIINKINKKPPATPTS